MKNIPPWIIKAFDSEMFKCHSCERSFTPEDLDMIGIRSSIKNSEEVLFLDCKCSECSKVTCYELKEMDLIQFSLEVLKYSDFMKGLDNKDFSKLGNHFLFKKDSHDLNKFNSSDNEYDKDDEFEETDDEDADELYEGDYYSKFNFSNMGKKKSKITLKEIKDARKALKNISHYEFLEKLGMPPEEIDKYNKKGKNGK